MWTTYTNFCYLFSRKKWELTLFFHPIFIHDLDDGFQRQIKIPATSLAVNE